MNLCLRLVFASKMQAPSKPNLVQRTGKFLPLAAACAAFTAWGLYQLQVKKDFNDLQPNCVSTPETADMAQEERKRMDHAAKRL